MFMDKLIVIIITFFCICTSKFTVSELCGENVTASSGSILTQNYPNSAYLPNTDCRSTITTPENTVIYLNIVDMKTEDPYDPVTIYDGPSTADNQLGKYTGELSNIHINASSNQVLVHFTSDDSNNYRGFNITFASVKEESDSCGGNFTGSSGNIESPNYPGDYEDNLDCNYELSTPEDTALTLKIVDLDLDSCCDFIEIYDGPTQDNRLLGKLTGNSSNGESLYASTNQALVYFHTDSTVEKSGFYIGYTEREKCEQEVSGTYGAVISPGYPFQPYPNDQNCYYKISLTEGTAVNIEIFDLSLEDGDYIEIFDGITTSSAYLGRYTGQLTNLYILASTHEALIYFHSDSSGQGKGFYIYIEEREINPNCPVDAYSTDFGVIVSPLFPETYPSDTDCYYHITTPENTQITLHTNFLDVEGSSNCSMDFVEIYDGPTTNNSLAKLCGSGPVDDIISSSNQVFIRFHSNNQNVGEGFNITYNTNPCPDPTYFSDESGTIYSPGFPLSNYPKNANCLYYIETPYGSQAHVTVVYSDVQSSTNCTSDYIRLYDGSNDYDELLDELCGSNSMIEYDASTNEVLIEFHSDSFSNNRGFVISYVSTYHYEDDDLENLEEKLIELIEMIE